MTPRLRTEVERGMSVPQSETEVGREMDEQIFFRSNDDKFGFVLIKFEFVLRHPNLKLRDTGLRGRNENREIGEGSRSIQLIVIRETVMGERMALNNRSNGLSIKNEKDRPQDRTLGHTKAEGRRIRRQATDRNRARAIKEIGVKQ